MNDAIRYIIVGILVVCGATQLYGQSKANENEKAHQNVYRDLDKIGEQIQIALGDLAAGNSLEFDDDVIFSEKVLPEFYRTRDYKPAWSDYATLLDALGALEHSWEDGLNPDDYHAGHIRAVVRQIKAKLGDNVVDYPAVARFDILVTDAVLLYAYHILDGKVDPESLDPNWNYSFRDIKENVPEKLQQAIQHHQVSQSLYRLRPRLQLYQSYRDLMIKYQKMKEEGISWSSIGGTMVIKVGEEDKRIPEIRQRLQRTGELTAGSNMESMVYDDQLKTDIERFQRANGLDIDGVIGPGTLKALNESLESRIEKLRVNMERARWVVSNLSDRYIVVNIPAFKAYYMEDNKIRFATNVQVGRPYTKTPVFKDRLAYIEFNPTWTVPTSIIRNSIIPHLKKDPGYLGKNHFDLLDQAGNMIDTSTINFSKISASNFPYIVRQRPGSWNSLGLVKFIFPNKYSVFMHDTPSKSLFDRSERAFSHGCIRTQHPMELAAILLEGTAYNKAKIDEIIQSGKTTRVNPANDVDVMLLYWTVGFDENQKLTFYKDIYNRDGKVLEQLESKSQNRSKGRF